MSAKRDLLDYLTDIVEAIDAAQSFVAEMDIVAFRADRRTIYAVTHALEIVGEATKRIPALVRERYPAIPWRLMAGMRDRLAHGYDTVDPDVWRTVMDDLPMTRSLMGEMLRQERAAAGESSDPQPSTP